MSRYLLAVKVLGAVNVALVILNAQAGRASFLLNLIAVVSLAYVVYASEGLHGRFFADSTIFDLTYEDLQERLNDVPAQKH